MYLRINGQLRVRGKRFTILSTIVNMVIHNALNEHIIGIYGELFTDTKTSAHVLEHIESVINDNDVKVEQGIIQVNDRVYKYKIDKFMLIG
jgi:hypothetical protein